MKRVFRSSKPGVPDYAALLLLVAAFLAATTIVVMPERFMSPQDSLALQITN